MKKTTIIITGIIFMIAGILVFVGRSALTGIFFRAQLLRENVLRKISDEKDIQALRLENETLKTRLAELERRTPSIKKDRFAYVSARVYSRYPFNDMSEIVIDKGTDEGMVIGMPVAMEENILLGKIVSVKRTQSGVQTIFDPRWRSSVGVGNTGAKAVLKGGTLPTLEFLPADASVAVGEKVINISPEFPLSFLVGTIMDMEKTNDGSWLRARVRSPGALQTADTVFVIANFP